MGSPSAELGVSVKIICLSWLVIHTSVTRYIPELGRWWWCITNEARSSWSTNRHCQVYEHRRKKIFELESNDQWIMYSAEYSNRLEGQVKNDAKLNKAEFKFPNRRAAHPTVCNVPKISKCFMHSSPIGPQMDL